MKWQPDRLDEPSLGDVIYLVSEITGKPDGRLVKVMRLIAEDRNEELWEIVDKNNTVRIVTAGATERTWIEVLLD